MTVATVAAIFHSDFLNLSIDLERLSEFLAERLGRRYRLTALKVKCTYPVFRGDADGAPSVFVKIGTADEWRRTVRLLEQVGACGLFAKFLTDAPLDYLGHMVFVTEWRNATVIFPEDMNERQSDSFVAGCVTMSRALQSVRDFTPIADSPIDPERLFVCVEHYVRRHPRAGRLLSGLVGIPIARRTFGVRPLHVIHGDFHSKNFGFVGDSFASVFDFDQLTQGLACGDLTNALVERFSCLGLSAPARRRLAVTARRLVDKSPWPKEDFVVACNVLRLRFAARRIGKHPDSGWIALDILRRDRKIREFLQCLEAE